MSKPTLFSRAIRALFFNGKFFFAFAGIVISLLLVFRWFFPIGYQLNTNIQVGTMGEVVNGRVVQSPLENLNWLAVEAEKRFFPQAIAEMRRWEKGSERIKTFTNEDGLILTIRTTGKISDMDYVSRAHSRVVELVQQHLDRRYSTTLTSLEGQIKSLELRQAFLDQNLPKINSKNIAEQGKSSTTEQLVAMEQVIVTHSLNEELTRIGARLNDLKDALSLMQHSTVLAVELPVRKGVSFLIKSYGPLILIGLILGLFVTLIRAFIPEVRRILTDTSEPA